MTFGRSRTLLLCLLLVPAIGRTQFTESFSDGDITNDPTWSGDLDLFTVVEEDGDLMLRSNSATSGTYYLSTPSTQAANALWEFFIDLRFSTSGANYVDVYLMAQQQDLAAQPDGYFVRIGDTADEIALYRRQGGSNTQLISAPAVVTSSSSNPVRIRVTRDPSDNWTLSYDDGDTGTFTIAGTATDAAISSSTHFGIRVVQSTAAGPVNNHYFDDIIVSDIPVDGSAPVPVSAVILDQTTVDVSFDEPLDPATAEDVSNYSADNGLGTPASAALQGATTVRLIFSTAFVSGTTYTLSIDGVEDPAGNATAGAQIEFLFFIPDDAEAREVVINELMVDPTPSQGLPEAEYIELFNATTDKYFDLEGWQINTNSSSATLPAYTLGPGAYVLLVGTANAPLFDFVPDRIPYGLSSTALTNSGNTVTLLDPDGTMIDQVTYDIGWYGDPDKDDGGWSLEQVDPFSPCSGINNWHASNAANGGTPGAENSIFDPTPDTTGPELHSAFMTDSLVLELHFNEPMDPEGLVSAEYVIDPDLGIAGISVPSDATTAQLTLDQAPVLGTFYTITVNGATDCVGNPIASGNSSTFAIPEDVAPGDLVINEVLYDPIGSGSDLVELYNRSEKVLSLTGMFMANEDDDGVANLREITAEAYILLPGGYVVLTPNINSIVAQYPATRTDRALQTPLPNYVNTQGTVVLLSADSTVIDLFRYHDNMHFPLVSNTEGFSLERIDPDRPTDDPTNWQTASEMAGMATPGFENSQYAPAPVARGEMTIDPAIFSPDNDGHQDVLNITYMFEQDGFVGTLIIFDVAGREVRRLMDSRLLGTTGTISWDGTFEDGSKGRIGPYIVMMEAFDLEGNVERFKKTVTLAHFLD